MSNPTTRQWFKGYKTHNQCAIMSVNCSSVITPDITLFRKKSLILPLRVIISLMSSLSLSSQISRFSTKSTTVRYWSSVSQDNTHASIIWYLVVISLRLRGKCFAFLHTTNLMPFRMAFGQVWHQ